ncbi:uncharacterized protein PG986_012390 [Apiospora aurea]|uniref:Uncharacterized protein n=1 Tax=Apiospora aurea TaxID=335848 RepID=A0ABR1PZU1_9PEZI
MVVGVLPTGRWARLPTYISLNAAAIVFAARWHFGLSTSGYVCTTLAYSHLLSGLAGAEPIVVMMADVRPELEGKMEQALCCWCFAASKASASPIGPWSYGQGRALSTKLKYRHLLLEDLARSSFSARNETTTPPNMHTKEDYATTAPPAPFPVALADYGASPSPSRPDTPDHQHHQHGRNYSIVSIASSCQSTASHFHQEPLAVAGDSHLHQRHSAAATIDSIVSPPSSSAGTRSVMVNNIMMAPLVLTSDIVKSP